MKKINLFIACSTKSDVLNEQKSEIVKLCKKLNSEYAKNHQDVLINAVGYDDLERRRRVVKDYINNKADIVVFLVDDTLGDFLEYELEEAVRQGRKFRRPELLVYLSENIDESLESKVKKILEKDGLLFDPLKDTDNLKNSIEKRIRGYVNSYDSKIKEQRLTKVRFWGLPILVILLFIVLIIAKIIYDTAEQQRLLIAGGGSAKNLLDDLAKDTISSKYWIYAPIPSEKAYNLLTEETEMDVDSNDYKKRNYYTIILSAGKAEENNFLRDTDIEKYRETGIVVGIHVGDDPLVIYSDKKRDTSDIKRYLKFKNKKYQLDTSVRVYTTNPGSGTLSAYNKFFQDSIIPQYIYYSTTRMPDSNWIALGSKYYQPIITGEHVASVLNTLPKPVYIYFMKYKNKKGKYDIPKAIQDYLKATTISADTNLMRRINDLDPLVDSLRNTILFDNYQVSKPIH